MSLFREGTFLQKGERVGHRKARQVKDYGGQGRSSKETDLSMTGRVGTGNLEGIDRSGGEDNVSGTGAEGVIRHGFLAKGRFLARRFRERK